MTFAPLRLFVSVGCLSVVAACSTTTTPDVPDADPPYDAGTDAGSDSGTDAGADAATDDAGIPCEYDLNCDPGWTCSPVTTTCVCSPRPEVCNGRDDDCDGVVDEASALVEQCIGACVDGTCETTPSSAWLRSTPTGTELLIVGSASPFATTGAPRRFERAFVAHDGSTEVSRGTYERDGAGVASFVAGQEVEFIYEPHLAPLARRGVQITYPETPSVSTLAMSPEGASLRASLGGEEHLYTSLASVLAELEPTSVADAEALLRILRLSETLSVTRIQGHGGAGIVLYRSRADFPGTIAGSLGFVLENPYTMPKSLYTYDSLAALPGIVVDGTASSTVSLAGHGVWAGSLDFTIGTGPTAFSGSLVLDALTTSSGSIAGGTFGLSVDGGASWDLPYTLAYDLDLRALVPVVAP